MYSSAECLPLDSQACKFLSPQERALRGSSELNIEVGSEAWYRPTIVAPHNPITIALAQSYRRRFQYFTETIIAACLGLEAVELSIEEIDPKTGLTIADPKVVTPCKDRDLTAEFYQKLAKYGYHLGRRQS